MDLIRACRESFNKKHEKRLKRVSEIVDDIIKAFPKFFEAAEKILKEKPDGFIAGGLIDFSFSIATADEEQTKKVYIETRFDEREPCVIYFYVKSELEKLTRGFDNELVDAINEIKRNFIEELRQHVVFEPKGRFDELHVRMEDGTSKFGFYVLIRF